MSLKEMWQLGSGNLGKFFNLFPVFAGLDKEAGCELAQFCESLGSRVVDATPDAGHERFHAGMKARISGLSGSTELNGERVHLRSFNYEAGRWTVEIASQTGTCKAVRACNLIPED